MTDDVLARIRFEAAKSRPEEKGRLLRPLGEHHIALSRRKESFDVELFADTAIELLEHASLFERMSFADAMADGGRIPPRLLARLLADIHLVSRPVIERAKLSDSDLHGVIDGDRSESTLMVIAKRAGTGAAITDRLVEHGSLKVHLALAANDGAKLSAGTFDRFSTMTTAQNDMDLALAKRSDLPLHIAKALYERISERSERRLAEMMERDRNRGRRALVLGSGKDGAATGR